MIKAELYQYIYIIIIILLTLLTSYGLRSIQKENSRKSHLLGFFLMIFMIVFIGTRPPSEVFADMTQYIGTYLLLFGGAPFEFSFHTDNIIYDNYIMWCASNYVDPTVFYISIALIYFGCIYFGCKKLFPNCPFESFLVYLAGFSTFSYATNGIKAGAAAAIFLLAFAYKDRVYISIILALISYGFHHSMQLVVASYLVVLLIKNPKYYLAFWFIALVLSALNVQFFQSVFADLTDDRGADYLEVVEGENANNVYDGTKGGFRIDFIIYSFMPIMTSWILKLKYKLDSFSFNLLLNLYTLVNGIWLLCIHANYTNRIAYLSWFLLPILLIYPYIKFYFDENQFKYYRSIVLLHLAFTAFMNFVYYA